MSLTLNYFPIAGRAEPIRLAFALTGIPFKDNRIPFDEWPKIKPTTPTGTIPVLDIEGSGSVSQSNGILRYVGALGNLYPTDAWLAAKVDEILDLGENLTILLFANFNKSAEEQKQYGESIMEGQLPNLLTTIDKLHAGSGQRFFIGDLSVADLKIFTIMDYIANGRMPGIPTDIIDSYPNLKASNKGVAVAIGRVPQPALTLHYFPLAGRAEPIRLAFALSGIPFKDNHIPPSEWPAYKPTTPTGTMPVLDIEGEGSVSQSNGILRYVGSLGKLYPTDPWQAAKVDEVMDLGEDLNSMLLAHFFSPEEEQLAYRKGIMEGPLPKLLSNLEKLHAGYGHKFFLGDTLTVADLKVYASFDSIGSGQVPGIPTDLIKSYKGLSASFKGVAVALGRAPAPALTLNYFPSPGRADPIRLAFALANIPFKDNHIPFNEWPKFKPTTPTGTVPVLDIEGEASVSQSNGILRYVGTLGKLYPSDPWLAAKADEIMDLAEDLNVMLFAHFFAPESEQRAYREGLLQGPLPKLLDLLEHRHTGKGTFFLGDDLTVADLKAYSAIDSIASGGLVGIPTDLPTGYQNLHASYVAVAKRVGRVPKGGSGGSAPSASTAPAAAPASSSSSSSASHSGAASEKVIKRVPKLRNDLLFAINGQKFSIPPSSVDLTMSLAEFIRRHASLKGTKVACAEGGCGACAVVLSRYDKGKNQVIHRSVNSCLRLLASVHGWAVTTIEGIGSQAAGYHPLQERIIAFNGSQCGYCTPGMVMTMYGGLKATEGKGGKNITMKQVESWFDGNICRCTGYRPILDAFKSFAKDSNIRDNFFETPTGPYDDAKDPNFPDFMKTDPLPLFIPSDSGLKWYRPRTLAEIFPILARFGDDEVKLVGGNTSVGIYKNDSPKVLIDVQAVPELLQLQGDQSGLIVGGSVTIADLFVVLHKYANLQKGEAKEATIALAQQAQRVANVHVRNFGTVAGNLMMARNKGFLSDLATAFLGAKATVTLASAAGTRNISFKEFLFAGAPLHREVLLSVHIPSVPSKGGIFRCYKAAIRPVNSHAFINAAFKFSIANGNITEATIALGGVMEDHAGSHAVLATRTQDFLAGKPLNHDTLQKANKMLKDEIVPVGDLQAYRHRLVTGFFYKFFLAALKSVGVNLGTSDSAINPVTHPGITSGTQEYPRYEDATGYTHNPVPKTEGKLQASGEARYTDDIPDVAGTLYAVYVLSSAAHAEITDIDISAAAKAPGFVRFISAKDIPGKNKYGVFGSESAILPEGEVLFHSHAIGLVVATSPQAARQISKLVKPVLKHKPFPTNLEDALKDKAKYVTPAAHKIESGDAAGVLSSSKNVARGHIVFGTQKHFYMELQAAYAIPDEDGMITLHCSTQGQGYVNDLVATMLGIPQNKVKAVHRRSGGAFGGKMTHAIFHCLTISLAAHVTKKPVRLVLSRNEDMRLHGGREEGDSEYEVAYDDNGKILALRQQAFMNMGWSFDLSGFIIFLFNRSLPEAYDIQHLFTTATLVKTATCTRTAVRGPGEIMASAIAETAIAQIAHYTGIPAETVRERNFYSEDDKVKKTAMGTLEHYTIPELWRRLKAKAKFDERSAAVKQFNQQNRWKKRGIAMTTVNYGVGVTPKAAIVNVYKDGSILIIHGGTEMGQGLNTKAAQVAATTLGQMLGVRVPIENIRFGDVDSFSIPNQNGTGGSTGSESVCGAVILACNALAERLKPILAQIRADEEKKAGDSKEEARKPADPTWQQITTKAELGNVNLQSQAMYGTGEEERFHYNIYGVGCSEVEIDPLTGELVILRTDMLYDCGKSLNPAVDIGQAEGAFVMGVGHYLRERELLTTEGEMVSDGTWEYKPPSVRDIPLVFNIEFLENNAFEKGILSSKASGEPPLVLSTSVWMAVRNAITDARSDSGVKDWFDMPVPATPDVIQTLCSVDVTQAK